MEDESISFFKVIYQRPFQCKRGWQVKGEQETELRGTNLTDKKNGDNNKKQP